MGLFPECPHCHCEADYVGPGVWACPNRDWFTECSIACPVCNTETEYSDQTHLHTCPACGRGSATPDAVDARQVAEVLALGKEANTAQLVGALLVSGGVVALGACVVFGVYAVRPGALNILLFAGGTVAYAVVGWCLARTRTVDSLTFLDRMLILSPALRVGRRLMIVWLLLWPGRLAGLGAIGVYRFIRARRRLRKLIDDARRRPFQHRENARL
jgi:hypothetical protein